MPDVQKSLLIRHSAEQMYDLVTDVADYPNFLPWCGGVEIRHQDEHSADVRININFKGIQQYFATHNEQTRPTSIDMTFADGPFKSFYGKWRFTPLREDACKIEFTLHYEFANFFLDKVIGPVFGFIMSTFVDAFVKRADTRYGRK